MFISTPRDFGNIVRDRRNQFGITQQELADRVGKARHWVVRFESGYARSASIGNLMKIMDALDLYVEVNVATDSDAPDEDDEDPMVMDFAAPFG